MSDARVAILLSGRGTNLPALAAACAAPWFPGEAALVVANRPGAPGLEKAEARGVPTLTIDHTPFGKGPDGRAAFEDALHEALVAARIDWICLAGFMRLFTGGFVDRWPRRILNVHPAILPAFKGLNVHERVLAAGARLAGCTVHFVNAEMDDGPIIGQAATRVRPDDDPETLAARIVRLENRLYPACLRAVVEGPDKVDPRALAFFDDAPE
ncbi:MAG: phosphoribosylglycinamide formyltransferase [Parvularculaceae bacterium]